VGKGCIIKRIEKIYQYIKEHSQYYTKNDLKMKCGFDAFEIAQRLHLLRNNVSRELNTLFKMGKIVKIYGRPVLYLDKETLEKFCGRKIEEGPVEIRNVEEYIQVDKEIDAEENSPFRYLIGAEGSLKGQVEQAKAAILYPPHGLHTLVVGQTGSGKTLFVNMMYDYGKQVKRFREDAPFRVFNCADYYTNPQLLMAQLFGHVKGSFTGADTEKVGLIEKANGGILFLDEIHRLPPEGQEMIFYFMDTGTFNRLGEVERTREAKVLIIGATTEDHTSSFLKTFIRRIPIVISIPSLNERPLKERLDMVRFLLSNEAHRVNKPISISSEAVRALISSVSFGNVGQLKSNIQLVCAKAFLNGIHNKNLIEVNYKILPDALKGTLLKIGAERKDMEELSHFLEEKMIAYPQGNKVFVQDDPYEPPFNLYQIIGDKVKLLKDEGMSEALIKRFIATDINLHIKSFYNKFNSQTNTRQNILKIVDKRLFEVAESIVELAGKKLKKEYTDQFLYALSLHISSLFKRIKSNQLVQYSNIESVIEDYPMEYAVAMEIKQKLEEEFHIQIPKVELEYFALLLQSVQGANRDGKIVIVVIAHGNSTASSMRDVVQKLFGYNNIIAVDMPIEVSPEQVLEETMGKLQNMNVGKGVLLLVDMGSLTNFDTLIMEKLDVKIRVLDMVSTPLVLEAARKSNISGMDLDSIYFSLKKFKGYDGVVNETDFPLEPEGVILTICSTGEGTAVKLKEMVEQIVKQIIVDKKIDVIPIGLHSLQEEVEKIKAQHNIIAAVGVANPNMEVPFISLEALLDGRGEKALKNILKTDLYIDKAGQNVVVRKLCEDSLQQFLMYMNPGKILSVLIQFQEVLEAELRRNFNNHMKIKLIVHCGCALERMVIREGLVYKGSRENINSDIIKHVKKAAEVFKETVQLELSDDEILYISEML
jgi:transcriptional regulatory protein LevR/transcriptional regulator with AAA-type ATPase domain